MTRIINVKKSGIMHQTLRRIVFRSAVKAQRASLEILPYKHRNRSEYTRDMVHFHIEPCVGTSPYSIKVKLDNFADFLSSCMVSQIF
jgi:hypothetical protein